MILNSETPANKVDERPKDTAKGQRTSFLPTNSRVIQARNIGIATTPTTRSDKAILQMMSILGDTLREDVFKIVITISAFSILAGIIVMQFTAIMIAYRGLDTVPSRNQSVKWKQLELELI